MATGDRGKEILAQLKEQRRKRPELAETIDLHYALIEAQAQVEVSPSSLALTAEEAKALLQQGIPLLQPRDLEVDWEAFARLYNQVCRIAAQHRPELAGDLEAIQSLPGDDPEMMRALVAQYLEEGRVEGAEALGLNGELLAFVLNNALHPFFRAHAAALAPLIDESLWYHGRCPLCGGQPDFASLAQETGARRLLCSRCDTEWAFKRVGCPYCGNEDHRKLAYYPSEDGAYRLYVCEECKRYLKAIDQRELWQKVLLPVERLVTVGMDLAAVQEGYKRG